MLLLLQNITRKRDKRQLNSQSRSIGQHEMERDRETDSVVLSWQLSIEIAFSHVLNPSISLSSYFISLYAWYQKKNINLNLIKYFLMHAKKRENWVKIKHIFFCWLVTNEKLKHIINFSPHLSLTNSNYFSLDLVIKSILTNWKLNVCNDINLEK